VALIVGEILSPYLSFLPLKTHVGYEFSHSLRNLLCNSAQTSATLLLSIISITTTSSSLKQQQHDEDHHPLIEEHSKKKKAWLLWEVKLGPDRVGASLELPYSLL
jgi:hypothetical protein